MVRPRPLRCHADGFTARPIIPLGGGLLIVAVGVAWAFILAICVRIELRAIARVFDRGPRMYVAHKRSHWR